MGNKTIILKREITTHDINLIRQLIESEGHKGRTHISKKLCQIWDWRTPTGLYRDIACRDLLRRLHKKGLIDLPQALHAARKTGCINKTSLPVDFQVSPFHGSIQDFSSIGIDMVRGGSKEKLYNALIGAYHYLGYHQGNGTQLKYIISGDGHVLACIGFGAAAYKIAARDQHIGWDHETRETNLDKIVNNNRFLILPGIRVPNLASYILGRVSQRLRSDWQDYHKTAIVLIETFVEKDRFIGTSYRAANWRNIGQTKGRGRNDRQKQKRLPLKDVYIYPLTKNYIELLQVSVPSRRDYFVAGKER